VLIRSVGIFGSFELHFESLHSNLKSIHGLNGSLSTCRIVETDKTKAFALIGCPINKDFRADDVAKGKKHLHQLSIAKLLGQVVDEQIATFRSGNRAAFTIPSIRSEMNMQETLADLVLAPVNVMQST